MIFCRVSASVRSAAVKLRICWFCCLLAVYAAERLSTCLRKASNSASFWDSKLSCSRIFFSSSVTFSPGMAVSSKERST